MTYEEFRDAIRDTLQAAGRPMTWTEIRTAAKLPQKFPNNQWVRRLDCDILLLQAKGDHGIIYWSLDPQLRLPHGQERLSAPADAARSGAA